MIWFHSIFIVPNTIAILSETDILSDITSAIDSLKVSIEQNQKNLEICKKDSELSEETIVKLNEELQVASTRYEYFQGLNSYISDLSDFLDAKVIINAGV